MDDPDHELKQQRLNTYGYTWGPSNRDHLDLFFSAHPGFQIAMLFPSGRDPQVDLSNPASLKADMNGIHVWRRRVGDITQHLEVAREEAERYALVNGYELVPGHFATSKGPLMSVTFRTHEDPLFWPVWVFFPDVDEEACMWFIQQGKRSVPGLIFLEIVESFAFLDV